MSSLTYFGEAVGLDFLKSYRGFMRVSKNLAFCSIFALLPCAAHAEKIWENSLIEIGNGKSIWARIDRDSTCFNMTVGSINTSISGAASNCSDTIKGTWVVRACDGYKSLYGGPSDALQQIVKFCI